jgi:CRP-like cAMP-binding protein
VVPYHKTISWADTPDDNILSSGVCSLCRRHARIAPYRQQEYQTLQEPAVWDQLAERLDPGSLRPHARAGINSYPISDTSGIRFVVLRNPEGSAFLRLPNWQYEAVLSMDGSQSMRDLVGRHYEKQGVLDLAGMRALVADMREGGFLVETGQDCYALLRQRLPASPGAWIDRTVSSLNMRWRPAVLQAMLLGACAVIGALFRPAFMRWAIILLALVGIVLPLSAALVDGRAADGNSAGLALSAVLIVWAGGLIHNIAGGIAGAALGRPPQRAGIRLCCGIPTWWVDPREAIVQGPNGARQAWLAGPIAVIVAAALVFFFARGSASGIFLSLCLVVLGSVLLSPFRAIAWNDLAAHAWSLSAVPGMSCGFGLAALPLKRAKVSDTAAAQTAARIFNTLAVLWVIVLTLGVGALARIGIGGLPAALWDAANPASAALVLAAILYIAACGLIQYGVPALRRWSPSGHPVATLRRRYVPRHVRRRAASMRQCDVLHNLTAEQLTALAETTVEVRFPRGMDIVVQGEVGDEFYILVDGVADVIDEGGPVVMQQLRRGDSFGKYAMLYQALRAATVRAVTDVRLLKIDRPAFDAYLAPRLILEERLKALAEERAFLAAVPALAPLGQSALDLLLPRLVKERYEPDEVIIRQGDRGDRFYIIRGGTAEVVDESSQPPRRLAVLTNGNYFGEIALMLDRPRVATVRALVEVTVWSLSRADFDLVLGRYFNLTDTFASTGRKRLEMNRALSA